LIGAYEHLNAEAGAALVQRCARMLKPSGMFILGTPNIHIRDFQSESSRRGHINMFDQNGLRAILEPHFERILLFSMSDEVVHTGHPRAAWYFFALAFVPRTDTTWHRGKPGQNKQPE
jgi:hypothetical protein